MQTPEDKYDEVAKKIAYWCVPASVYNEFFNFYYAAKILRESFPVHDPADVSVDRDAECQPRVDRLEAALKEGEGITEKPQAQ